MTFSYGTGRRKSSSARVWLTLDAQDSSIIINKSPINEYFSLEQCRQSVIKPFKVTGLTSYTVRCTVRGGGFTGQADAIRLGISRALKQVNESLYPTLRAHSLMTRDSRSVERKKYGHRKARKVTQFSKR